MQTKKPLFEAGKCFICGESCNPDVYCHYVCAMAYTEKKKELKQSLEEKK